MDIVRQIALGTLAAGITACSYPDFTYGTETNGTNGTSAASGTFGTIVTGGTGGTSGSSGSSETSGSSGSSGSTPGCQVTHVGDGSCEYTPGAVCGCSGEDKCSVIDASGRSACTPAGPTPAYEKCVTDGDCVAGTFCEALTHACATICRNVKDCRPGAQCVPAQLTQTTVIPGLKLCTAHCEPVKSDPCGSSVTCGYRDDLAEFDCFSSLRFKEDAPCQSDSNCDKGLICVLTTGHDTSTCQPWCKPANTTSANGCPKAKSHCTSLSNVAIEYDKVAYGVCL